MSENASHHDPKFTLSLSSDSPILRSAVSYTIGMIGSYLLFCFLAWIAPNSWWTWLWGTIVVGMFCGRLTLYRITIFCLVPVFVGWIARYLGQTGNANFQSFQDDVYITVLPQTLIFSIVAYFADQARIYRMEYTAAVNIDPLTRLGNLRLIQEHGEALWRMFEQEKNSCSVLFIDCDSLKAINDQLGHDEGDQYLIDVAALLEKCWGDAALIARRSGDEFVVISGLSQRENLEERIQEILAEPLPMPESCTAQGGFSIGAMICSPVTGELKDAIRKAEQAMYQAKSLGKNQFVIEQ